MKRIRIILYHRIENLSGDYNMLAVRPENFRQHMKWISENYEVLQLDDSISDWFENTEKDGVIVTFDDGYYDWLYKAAPILSEYQIPASMFITTGNIGKKNELWTDSLYRAIFESENYNDHFELNDDIICSTWQTRSLAQKVELYTILRKIFQISSDSKRKEYEKQLLEWAGFKETGRADRRILCEEEIQKLSRIEGISIGAHCVSHPSLKWLSRDEQEAEIAESKRTLENIIGKEISLFSYPFGTKDDYSLETIKILKSYGFRKAVTGFPGAIKADMEPYQLPRFTIRNYDIEHFKKYMKNVVFGEKQNKIFKPGKHSKISYAGKVENDSLLFNGNDAVVIWGTGMHGKELYDYLKSMNRDNRVIAFGDNDESRWGTEIEQVPVLNIKQIKEIKYNKIFLVKGRYDWEICKGLIENGIENIHWIII